LVSALFSRWFVEVSLDFTPGVVEIGEGRLRNDGLQQRGDQLA
jgi:hypothetical protein